VKIAAFLTVSWPGIHGFICETARNYGWRCDRGAALTLAVPATAAQAKAAVPGVINVPCNANALKTAISTANGGGAAVLALSANCTYSIVARA
jgi:hypothetical protein